MPRSVWEVEAWFAHRIGCGHGLRLARQEQKFMIETAVLPQKANGALCVCVSVCLPVCILCVFPAVFVCVELFHWKRARQLVCIGGEGGCGEAALQQPGG